MIIIWFYYLETARFTFCIKRIILYQSTCYNVCNITHNTEYTTIFLSTSYTYMPLYIYYHLVLYMSEGLIDCIIIKVADKLLKKRVPNDLYEIICSALDVKHRIHLPVQHIYFNAFRQPPDHI
jgi:hypothetical protein